MLAQKAGFFEPLEFDMGRQHLNCAHRARLQKRKKKRNTNLLGGFASLLQGGATGRLRSRPWVLKAIAQLYYDKLAGDVEPGDSAGPCATKTAACDFVYDWHLHR
jgi:hypothetical protein